MAERPTAKNTIPHPRTRLDAVALIALAAGGVLLAATITSEPISGDGNRFGGFSGLSEATAAPRRALARLRVDRRRARLVFVDLALHPSQDASALCDSRSRLDGPDDDNVRDRRLCDDSRGRHLRCGRIDRSLPSILPRRSDSLGMDASGNAYRRGRVGCRVRNPIGN